MRKARWGRVSSGVRSTNRPDSNSHADVLLTERPVSLVVEVGDGDEHDLCATGEKRGEVVRREGRAKVSESSSSDECMREEGKSSRLCHKPSCLPVRCALGDHLGDLEILGNLQPLGIDQDEVGSVRDSTCVG